MEKYVVDYRCPGCGSFRLLRIAVASNRRDEETQWEPVACNICRSVGVAGVRIGDLRCKRQNKAPDEGYVSDPKESDYVKHIHRDPRNGGK